MEATSPQNEPVGFAGLTSLVSKIPNAPRQAPAQRAEAHTPERDTPLPAASTSSPPPTPHTGDDRRGKIVLTGVSITLVVGVLLIIIAMTSNNQKPQYTANSPQYPQSPSSTEANSKPPPSPPAYAPPPPPEVVEEKPEASDGFVEPVLYHNQIYYCLLENERINILRNRTDDSSDQQINSFNERVHDFNARCGNYKYDPREMDAAKRQYDAKIGTITAQFTASLTPTSEAPPLQPSASAHTRPQSVPVSPPAQPTWAAAPTPVPMRPPPSSPIVEAVPPVEQGHQHSREELYYCFAESVRLDWAKKTIDMTAQPQVDAFKSKINDFNMRCTHFHSEAADRDAAKKQLASTRATLKAQGIAMAKSWR